MRRDSTILRGSSVAGLNWPPASMGILPLMTDRFASSTSIELLWSPYKSDSRRALLGVLASGVSRELPVVGCHARP